MIQQPRHILPVHQAPIELVNLNSAGAFSLKSDNLLILEQEDLRFSNSKIFSFWNGICRMRKNSFCLLNENSFQFLNTYVCTKETTSYSWNKNICSEVGHQLLFLGSEDLLLPLVEGPCVWSVKASSFDVTNYLYMILFNGFLNNETAVFTLGMVSFWSLYSQSASASRLSRLGRLPFPSPEPLSRLSRLSLSVDLMGLIDPIVHCMFEKSGSTARLGFTPGWVPAVPTSTAAPGSHVYLLYLCLKYAFNVLVVSD